MPSFHDPLRLFLFANNQIGIHGRKELGTFQTVERIVNTRQRINVFFRDAIQLAIIDAKTPTTVFFLRAQRVMTKDFQRVGRYLHQAFLNFFMNDASFSRRDSHVGSLVDWSMITSKNPVFHIRLRGCRLVGLREKPRKFPE
ncbi:hypothetical protein TNCV_2572911 [Trichonephila clavipes]|nr:hypothetical protein TNCV_2572911 [Trichonephila clavipes]